MLKCPSKEPSENWDLSPPSRVLEYILPTFHRHTPASKCKDKCTCIHTPCSFKHLNKAALAATTLLSPRTSHSPHGCGPAANQFSTNNNDPLRKIQNRKQLIKSCFMSVFLYNERPLVFLSIRWGHLKEGAMERERRRAVPWSAHCLAILLADGHFRTVSQLSCRITVSAHTCTLLLTKTVIQSQRFARRRTKRSCISWKSASLFHPLLFE